MQCDFNEIMNVSGALRRISNIESRKGRGGMEENEQEVQRETTWIRKRKGEKGRERGRERGKGSGSGYNKILKIMSGPSTTRKPCHAYVDHVGYIQTIS